MKSRILAFTIPLALLLPFQVAAENPPIFEISDADSTIIMLGSVHLLPGNDDTLPEPINAAYAEADRLVFELPAEEIDPQKGQALAMSLGVDKQGRGLAQLLSEKGFAEARQLAERNNLPFDPLRRFEPWLVLLQFQAINLQRLGFSTDSGVEAQLKKRGEKDQLPMAGLESLQQQFGFFDEIPLETQERMLLEYLRDIQDSPEDMKEMVAAWRHGNLEELEKLVDEGFADDPALAERFLASRNRDWVSQIIELLELEGTTLVVVGTAHLVGDVGIPELLEEKGIDVRRR